MQYRQLIKKGSLLLLICMMVLSSVPFPSYAISYGTNLIINGTFEDGNMNNWTKDSDPSNYFIVDTYSNLLVSSPDSSTYGLDFYPSMEKSNTIYQIVDISSAASIIDQGALRFNAQGYIRCYRAASTAKIIIEQLDGSDLVIPGGTQELVNDSMDKDDTWQNKSVANVLLSSGARKVKITLSADIPSSDSSDGYIEFDDIQFSVNQSGVTMSVSGNSNVIQLGDTTPSVSDDTDFGAILTSSGTISKTFTITNTDGTGATLNLSLPIILEGTNASDFTVIDQPSTVTLANGATTTFTVQFDPSDVGSRTATVKVNSNIGITTYDFTIKGTGNPDPLAIDTDNPTAGTIDTVYGGHTFTATGGTGSKSYAVTSGSLPAGLSLSSGGLLSGTPTAYGSYTFTVTVTDSASTPVTDSHSYSMTVNPAALVIGTGNPTTGTVGTVYSGHTFTATGGTGSKSYVVTSGSLPTGLSLSSAGVLSGTPTAYGLYTFTVTVTDSASTPVTDSHSYSMTVNPAALVIETGNPTTGTVGTVYSGHTFTATGGTGSKSYAVTSGSLPAGLSLSNGGVLSGTPTAYGLYTFTVTVTDSASTPVTDSHSYSMTINPAVLQINTANPTSGVINTTYVGYTFTSTGGITPMSYAVTSGSLPAGLSLSSGGILSGTPTNSGNFTFTVTVTDSASTPITDSHAYSMTIQLEPLVIDTANPPTGTVDTVYAGHTFTATGGTSPRTYAVTSGSLPAGLSLSSGGVLSGTPTSYGSYTFTVTVTDSALTPVTDSHSYSMTINPAALVIGTGNPTTGTVGAVYSGHTFIATGGVTPKRYTVTSGSLPAGLSLSSGGVLSGTPTAYGSYTFTVTVTDSASTPVSDSHSYSMTVNPASLVLETANPVDGTVDETYAGHNFVATGGVGNKSFAVTSGSLPAGLSLSTGGVLSGVPTTSGSSVFVVTVTDSNTTPSSDSHSFTMGVYADQLKLNESNPADGTINASYVGHTFTAAGGTGVKQFVVTTGNLPAGLTLSSSGILSGTPTTSGTYTFSVTATDSAVPPVTDSRSYSIIIHATQLTLNASNPVDGIEGTVYTGHMFTSDGGTGIKQYSITSGNLPAGLVLKTDGTLEGTPSTSGNYQFEVMASDSGTPIQTVQKIYTMTVTPKLLLSDTNLAEGTEETAYNDYQFAATGGAGAYHFSISSGGLPSGMVLSESGNLSGTPMSSGTFTFSVSVSDTGSIIQTDTKQQNLVIKAKAQSGGSGGGRDNSGDGSSNAGGSVETPAPAKTIPVTGQEAANGLSELIVKSSTDSNGNTIDEVSLDNGAVGEILDKLMSTSGNVAKIAMSDATTANGSKVIIPKSAVELLKNQSVQLEVETPAGSVKFSEEAFNNSENDLYFIMRTVVNADESEQVVRDLRNDQQMKINLEDSNLEKVGKSIVVETNFAPSKTQMTIPLEALEIPSSPEMRQALEKSLTIYIDHSDGDKVIKTGKLMEYKPGRWGVVFEIDKYSTFTVFRDKLPDESVPQDAGMEDAVNADGESSGMPLKPEETNLPAQGQEEQENENLSKEIYVFIATRFDDSDAFAGTVLALLKDGDLLRVGSTESELKSVVEKVTTVADSEGQVYILGLEMAIPKKLETLLSQSGYDHIVRIGGRDKYETAQLIAEEIKIYDPKTVVLSGIGGLDVDKSEIASICAQLKAPILFTSGKGIPDETIKSIQSIQPDTIYALPNVSERELDELSVIFKESGIRIIQVKDISELNE